ncbi:TIR domain-containing protein [Nonomuraea roseoviolacea]|nr:TIR domain-containing protein [Nonomuraea roseoviolacea]
MIPASEFSPFPAKVPIVYDAFISYSRAKDAPIAKALRDELHRFIRPWYKMRALRIFLDQASLSANPGLWPSIREALDSSRCFILLASPEAAASPWPSREIEHWLAGHSVDDLLLVLTDGTLEWAGDGFDPARSNALPAVLRDAYPQEPRWVDLTWARSRDGLHMRDPRFGDAVAELAAPLHGRPKEDLTGEDVRQHRLTRRLIVAVAVALAVLAASASAAAVVATRNADKANRWFLAAESGRLAALALTERAGRMDAALVLAAEAWRTARTAQARGSLLSLTHEAMRGIVAFPRVRPGDPVPFSLGTVAVAPGGRVIAASHYAEAGSAGAPLDGRIYVWTEGRPFARVLRGPPEEISEVRQLAFGPDGRFLAAAGQDGDVRVWDLTTGAARTLAAFSSEAARPMAVSADHRRVAAQAGAGRVVFADLLTGEPAGERAGTLFGIAPDGRHAFGKDRAEFPVLWDMTSDRVVRLRHRGPYENAGLSPDGRLVLLATGRGADRLSVFDARTGGLRWSVRPSKGSRIVAMTARPVPAAGPAAGKGTVLAEGVTSGGGVGGGKGAPSVEGAGLGGGEGLVDGSGHATGAGLEVGARLGDGGRLEDGAGHATGARLGGSAGLESGARLGASAGLGNGAGLVRTTGGSRAAAVGLGRAPGGSMGAGLAGLGWAPGGLMGLAEMAGGGGGRGPGKGPRSGKGGRERVAGGGPEGAVVAVWTADGRIGAYRVSDGRRTALSARMTVPDIPDPRPTLRFSPRGTVLAAGVAAGTGARAMTLLDARTGAHRSRAPADGVAFSADERTAVRWGWDEAAAVTTDTGDVGAKQSLEALHASAVSPDGRSLALISTRTSATEVTLWDLTEERPSPHPLPGALDGLEALAFSDDGRRLVAAGSGGAAVVWDTETALRPGRVATIPSAGALPLIVPAPDGTRAAHPGPGASVALRDLRTGRDAKLLDLPAEQSLDGLAFSPDGRHLLVTTGGEHLLWSMAEGQVVGRLPVTGEARFSGDGRVLGVADEDPATGRMTVVARRVPGLAETGRVVLSDYAQPEGLTSTLLKVQWTLNHAGDRLAETLTPGQYAEREVATGRRIIGCDQRAVVTSTGSGQPGYAPGERELAVPGDDGVLRFLDLRACGTRRTLRTGSGDLAFSPDGALLAGGEPLRLWDAATLEPLGEPLLDTLQSGLQFTARGSLLAAGPQGTLREWPLAPEALARRACLLAARGLTREEWERYRPPGDQTGRCPA